MAKHDERIARLRACARRQHDVFTLAQALDAGFSRATIRRRLEAGEWHELAPRVYRVALVADADWRVRTMAEALSTRGVASCRSALALYGLTTPPDVPEITVFRTHRTRGQGARRSSDQLDPIDVTFVDGIPATTPVRTLIDAAPTLPVARFEDVLDTAIVQRLVTMERLASRARELWARRRNGCAIVLSLLETRDPGLSNARNLWEAKVARIVRTLGLPPPHVNYGVVVGGRQRYLDFAWPDAKVAVEFDGFVPHSTRRVFDDDRVRQNDLVADGWTVFRVTKAMLDLDPAATFGPIAAAVHAKGSDSLQI